MPKKKKPINRFPSGFPLSRPPAKIQQISLSRSAPLPHPSELERYEAILPGAAERIFAMAEKQSTHRQRLETKAISIEGRNSFLGVIAGLLIGAIGLSIAGFCIYSGHDWAGGTLGGTTLVSLVGTFVYGTRQRRLEREQKYLSSIKNRR